MIDTTADSKMIGILNFNISFMLYPPSLYAINELGDASGVLKEARQDASMAQMIGNALILFCIQAMMAIGVKMLISAVLSMNCVRITQKMNTIATIRIILSSPKIPERPPARKSPAPLFAMAVAMESMKLIIKIRGQLTA